jgi:hypothetical protein
VGLSAGEKVICNYCLSYSKALKGTYIGIYRKFIDQNSLEESNCSFGALEDQGFYVYIIIVHFYA